jgi:hypothetical protein
MVGYQATARTGSEIKHMSWIPEWFFMKSNGSDIWMSSFQIFTVAERHLSWGVQVSSYLTQKTNSTINDRKPDRPVFKWPFSGPFKNWTKMVWFSNGPASQDRFKQNKIFLCVKRSMLAKLDHLKNEPSNNRTQIDHPNTGLVRFLIVHCTIY